MRRLSMLFFLIVLCATVTGGGLLRGQEARRATADQQSFEITVDGIGVNAEEVEFDRDAGVLEAKGSVSLSVPVDRSVLLTRPVRAQDRRLFPSGTGTIRADRVKIRTGTQTIEARGNVVVTVPGAESMVLEAREMTIRYRRVGGVAER